MAMPATLSVESGLLKTIAPAKLLQRNAKKLMLLFWHKKNKNIVHREAKE